MHLTVRGPDFSKIGINVRFFWSWLTYRRTPFCFGVSMVCTVSAGTAAAYYIGEQSRYYTGGQEPIGRWFASSAASEVTNGAEIDDATFERLHAGMGAAGEKLSQNADGSHADRVAGYDMTYSAPKSVTIVWALGDIEQRVAIEAAHDDAVRAALGVINDNAAFSRRGKGGSILEPVQLTGAIFQHGEARPTEREKEQGGVKVLEVDPQLHSHAVLFNWAQRADGSWGSIDGRQLFRWKMAAGAVYRAELAARLQGLGYGIERTDEKGLFEISDVPAVVREEFSGRRRGIVAAMRKHGLETAEAPALAASVTKAERRAKSVVQGHDRHTAWQERGAAIGFEVLKPGLAAITPQREAANNADTLVLLTETKAVFRHQDVVAAVAADLIGGQASHRGAAAVIGERVAAILKDQEIVQLGPDANGQSAYSTKAMVAMEHELAATAQAMSNAFFGAAPTIQIIAGTATAPVLSEEQHAALAHACRSNRLAVVEGAAGSGKTTTLSAIAETYRQAGYRVIGGAVAWRAAQQLGEECGFESRALDSWLARHRDGQDVFDRKTVLIVDEAGLLSTRQMHALLTAADANGSKIILSGDRRQLQAIGAGSGLDIVASQVASIRVDTNRRQKEAWARKAVSQLAAGEAEPALRAFDEHGCLHWVAGQKAMVQAALELWRGHRDNYPGQSVAVLTKSNADVRVLNTAMRAELRQNGQLRGNDVVVRAVDRSGAAYELAIAKGDRLEITTRNKALGQVNGTIGTVTRVEAEANGHARLTLAIGTEAKTFSTAELVDKRGRAKLGHAYATTIYNAQGVTVDRAIVIGSSGFSANQAYVATSRARERTDIVINSKEVDGELRAQARVAGMPLIAAPSKSDRLGQLVRGWVRQEAKENATAVTGQIAKTVTKARGPELEI
jgi:conjugative relaxase-like TrwC/TraI family protein